MKNTNVTIEKIGPKRAAQLLGGNTQNRNLRKRVVTQYAGDMAAGLWSDQGDPIRMNGDGTLLDGQHRLHAIIESGTTQSMVVVSGVSKSSILTMDTGAKRNLADVLKLHGYKNVTVLAAAARMSYLYSKGQDIRFKDAISNSQLMAYIEDNADLPLHSNKIMAASAGRPIVRAMRTPFVAIRHFGGSPADVDAFVDQVGVGTGLEEGDPAHTLRRTVENYLMSSSLRLAPVVIHAIAIKSWNAYVRGEQSQVLRFKPGGASPEAFPRIEVA